MASEEGIAPLHLGSKGERRYAPLSVWSVDRGTMSKAHGDLLFSGLRVAQRVGHGQASGQDYEPGYVHFPALGKGRIKGRMVLTVQPAEPH
ncbi:MAG: hypothetical protein J1E64_13705 [Acetatifactor sp.]|nr:hypothetical protein [Acetatifactor sp.]